MSELPTWWHYDKPYVIKDSLYLMMQLPENSIDLIVTSPNYNVGIDYGDTVDDNLPYEMYIENMTYLFNQMYRILKPDGRLCVNAYMSCGDAKYRMTPLMDFNTILKELGFYHHGMIVWDDRTVHKSSAFGSFKSASSPYLLSPCEGILVMYKDQWKKLNPGKNDISGHEFATWSIGRWNLPTTRRTEGHPATFPVELPLRCIKLFSYVNDVVYDPFLGSGTTILASRMTNRIGIGSEIEDRYLPIIEEKINSFTPSKNTEEYF